MILSANYPETCMLTVLWDTTQKAPLEVELCKDLLFYMLNAFPQ